MEPEFNEVCFEIRVSILELVSKARVLLKHSHFDGEQLFSGQHNEMKDNVMLALRHLEDARMRLGKAVQAYVGGTPCYEK